MARVQVDIGGAATLDVVGARRGSRWFLPLVFSDDLDLTNVTAATVQLKQRSTNYDALDPVLEVPGDVSQKASGVLSFEVSPDDTAEVAQGSYEWEVQLTSTDDLDGWAPLRGVWRVDDRVVLEVS
jgi:hypothetical protein